LPRFFQEHQTYSPQPFVTLCVTCGKVSKIGQAFAKLEVPEVMNAKNIAAVSTTSSGVPFPQVTV